MANGKPIPTFVTAQYGALTDEVSRLIHDKRVTRYRFRDRPVWAFSTRGQCPAPGTSGIGATAHPTVPCDGWHFLDASTGELLATAGQDVNPPER